MVGSTVDLFKIKDNYIFIFYNHLQEILLGLGEEKRMGTPLRTLCVYNDEDDVHLVVQALQLGGYDPIWERAATSRAMRAALKSKTWDIIVSEYTLPHFGGKAALELLRKTGPDVPFIIVSESRDAMAAMEMLNAGADDFVTKDNVVRLAPAVDRVLHEAKVRRDHDKVLQESEKLF